MSFSFTICACLNAHRWTYECDHLLEEIARLKDDFDKDLLWLRHEKGLQDILMKMADLRYTHIHTYLVFVKFVSSISTLLVCVPAYKCVGYPHPYICAYVFMWYACACLCYVYIY